MKLAALQAVLFGCGLATGSAQELDVRDLADRGADLPAPTLRPRNLEMEVEGVTYRVRASEERRVDAQQLHARVLAMFEPADETDAELPAPWARDEQHRPANGEGEPATDSNSAAPTGTSTTGLTLLATLVLGVGAMWVLNRRK